MQDPIYEAVERIKEACGDTNALAFEVAYSLDEKKWNRFWAALDIIEDTAEALSGYSKVFGLAGIGSAYLAVFGAMHALGSQQDAVSTLYETTGIPLDYKAFPRLNEIRRARRWVTHATDVRGDDHHSVGIVRLGLSADNCTVIRWGAPEDSPDKERRLEIPNFIKDQTEQVLLLLKGLTEHLQPRIDAAANDLNDNALVKGICPECNIDLSPESKTIGRGSDDGLRCMQCGFYATRNV